MKILHLLSQRPDSTGSGIYLRAIIEQAALHGHQNCLLAGIQEDNPASVPQVPDNACDYVQFGTDGDISHHIVGMSDIMPYVSRTFGSLTEKEINTYLSVFAAKLKNLVTAARPDIIHSHHLWLVSSLAKQHFPNIPLVTTCHGTDLRQFINNPHLQPAVLKGCQKIDRILALSDLQKDEIINLYGVNQNQVKVVGAGFNTRLFIEKKKAAPQPVHVLYAGKLSSFKGVPHLLKCLRRLQHLPYHLHLVGSSSGKELENCHGLAEKLEDKVTVYGAIPHQDLAVLMQQAHLFVFPSFFEGLPLVILEALACGCHVITNDLPGVKEILVKTGTQRLEVLPMPRLKTVDTPYPEEIPIFEKNLTDTLSHNIQKIYKQTNFDPEGIIGNINYFSWTEVYKRTEDQYLSLL